MEVPIINNRKNFLFQNHPVLHPQSLKYLEYWRFIKRSIIEGYWGQDTAIEGDKGSWRFMPPQLFFYSNCCYILHKEEGASKTAPRKKVHPNLDDIDWDFFYKYLEARGFSGFRDDNDFTSCRDVELFEKGKIAEIDIPVSAYNKKKKLKKYIPARQYLKQLHNKPLGIPIYDNDARNMVLLGSRGAGKSYWVADGCVLHEIITDGAKEYTEESIKNPAKVEVFVGAAIAAKSSEMLEKTLMGIQNLPGAWKPGTTEEIPSPLYKRTTGSLTQPSKIPWISRYEEKIGGEWKWQGSLSSVRHGIWTIENPEAAAGGRYNLVVCEEFGLLPNSITVHMSNIPTMFIEHKFGTALYLGTGGNIEKIHQSQAIFSDPEGFDALEFDDIWENTGKIGYFIPATYSNRKFKDSNGNTKVNEATEYYTNVRDKKKKSKTGSALDMEMMNYPLVPSEMFLSKSHNKFPIADLKHSLSELLTSKLLDASWKGEFAISGEGKIEWKNQDRLPIREFPVRDINNIEGCWEIFQMPVFVNDGIPFGRYGASLDPVDDDDNADKSRSLQSCFIMDLWTDTIVAEYTGRTQFAKDFYEQVRRGLIHYNCRLLYENNKKGVFAYFDQKNSLHLLEDTPEMLRDMDMQKLSAVGNKSKGIYMNEALINFGVDLYAQWLMSQAIGKLEGVTNANVLRPVGLIRESLVWSKDINADRVSSVIILMILRETKIKQIESRQKAVNKPSINKDEFWMKAYNNRMKPRYSNGMNSYTDARTLNNSQ